MPDQEARTLISSVTASEQYKSFTAQLTRDFEPLPTAFAIGRAGQVFVSIPIHYRGGATGSAFTAVVNPRTLKITETVALLVEPAPSGHRGVAWLNGRLSADVTVDDSGTVVSGWRLEKDKRVDLSGRNFVREGEEVQRTFRKELAPGKSGPRGAGVAHAGSFDCLNSCLSSAGISMYLLALVGVICAIACIGTAGLACYLCLATLLGGLIGVRIGCLRVCGYASP